MSIPENSQNKRGETSRSLISFLKKDTQKNAIAVLDGVRAIACLSVIAYHINRLTLLNHIWDIRVSPLASSVALVGWSGVTLFFVLSGFLLFMPYVRSLLFDSEWPSTHVFYLRRALRILPGYYVALFLLILLLQPEYLQPDHLKDLGLFLTFFMDASPATFQKINGPFWTLAIEWQFYLLLPLLAFGFLLVVKRGSLRRRVWMLALCLITMITWGVATRYWGQYYVSHPDQTLLVDRSVLDVALFFLYGTTGKYLEDFAIGMLVSVCYVLVQAPSEDNRAGKLLQHCSSWLWGAGILWLFFMATWSAFPTLSFLAPLIGVHSYLSELGFALGFGMCVTAILFGSAELKHPFAWWPLRWIGLISYSLYIWHLPILHAFHAYIVPFMQSWSNVTVYSLYWLCVGLLIIPFSYVFYRWIEQPWMKVADKMHAWQPRGSPLHFTNTKRNEM